MSRTVPFAAGGGCYVVLLLPTLVLIVWFGVQSLWAVATVMFFVILCWRKKVPLLLLSRPSWILCCLLEGFWMLSVLLRLMITDAPAVGLAQI